MLQRHPIYAYIPARDVARARRFYEDKVGLEPDEIGGIMMKDGIAIGGGAKAAWFKDSEGNIMALIEELPR